MCDCASEKRWQLDPDPRGDDKLLLNEPGCELGTVAEFFGFRRDAGEWAALVHPGLAEPLADWLEHEARCYESWGNDRLPFAVRVARVLLGVPNA